MRVEDIAPAAEAAEARIRQQVRETPVELSPALAEASGAEVVLKLENLQATGSFKLRGAFNTLLSLTAAERARGVVAASSGNHGAAVAYAARRLGCPALVFVPREAAAGKLAAIRDQGAEVRREDGDCVLAEAAARRFAVAEGRTYLSPYNDPRVIAGQGTLGRELARQAGPLDAVFLALGGGGLTAGVAGVLKQRDPRIEVVACSPARSTVMLDSLAAGRILDQPSAPTLSDGTAGGVEADAVTFALCQRLIDRTVTVEEAAIAAAMRLIVGRHRTLIEGAAGVAVAGFQQAGRRYAGRRVAIVLCGANVDLETLRAVLAAADGDEPCG